MLDAPSDAMRADAGPLPVWPATTENTIWRDLATDGVLVYAAGYQSVIGLGGVIPRTLTIAAFRADGTEAWRHVVQPGINTGVANCVEVDPTDGLIYFAGEISRAVTIGSVTLTPAGRDDAFVLVMDSAGNAVRGWRFGGTERDHGDALAIRADGFVLAGDAEGSVDFGGGPLTAGARGESVFAAAFGRDGTHRWSHVYTPMGGGGIDVNAIDVSSGGRVVMAGSIDEADSVDFGGATPLLLADGAYVLELSEAGAHTRSWVIARDRTSGTVPTIEGVVALDDSVVLAGGYGNPNIAVFTGMISLGSTTFQIYRQELGDRCATMPAGPDCDLLASTVVWRDGFVARFDSPTSARWTLRLAGPDLGGFSDLELSASGTELLLSGGGGRKSLGGVPVGTVMDGAIGVRLALDGSVLGAEAVATVLGYAGDVVEHPGGVIVQQTPGERGSSPGASRMDLVLRP